jgi:hypothetical protein
MSVFFGSADCKGVSGERRSKAAKAAKAAGLRGLRPALQVEGVGSDDAMIFWLRMAFTRRRLRSWRRVGLRVWVGGNL